jgi:hypothetical protein
VINQVKKNKNCITGFSFALGGERSTFLTKHTGVGLGFVEKKILSRLIAKTCEIGHSVGQKQPF